MKNYFFLIYFFTSSVFIRHTQIKTGTKFISGSLSFKNSIITSTDSYDGDFEYSKNRVSSIAMNAGLGYCIMDNLFIGGNVNETFMNFKQLEPIVSEGKSTLNSFGYSAFARLIAPIKTQVKPYLQIGFGNQLNKFKAEDAANNITVEKYKLNSINLSPAVSIFNRDLNRSFDFGLKFNFNKYKDPNYESEKYTESGFFAGYTLYF